MATEQNGRSVEEGVMMLVNEMQDNYMLENGIQRGDKSFSVKALPVGESGMIFLIIYRDEIIGTVLHYGDDVVSTSYLSNADGDRVN